MVCFGHDFLVRRVFNWITSRNFIVHSSCHCCILSKWLNRLKHQTSCMECLLWLSTHIFELNWVWKFNRIFPIVKFGIFAFFDLYPICFFILLMTLLCYDGTFLRFFRWFTFWRRFLSLLLLSPRKIGLVGSIMRGYELLRKSVWIFKIW